MERKPVLVGPLCYRRQRYSLLGREAELGMSWYTYLGSVLRKLRMSGSNMGRVFNPPEVLKLCGSVLTDSHLFCRKRQKHLRTCSELDQVDHLTQYKGVYPGYGGIKRHNECEQFVSRKERNSSHQEKIKSVWVK